MKRVLDRLESFDARSREYPIRGLLASTAIKSKVWRCDPRLDQGSEGACVGFGWAHELAAAPVRRKATAETARHIYTQAQKIDEWAGEDYEGTSVLAGAKVVKAMGRMPEYRWGFGIDDVLVTLSNHGPVVLGLPWKDSMFQPADSGFLDTSGTISGGHCILARGIRIKNGKPFVVLRNSWGRWFGLGGDCFIWADDLEALLTDGGEACVPVRR